MATQIIKSIKGKVVRLTRLDECGNVIEGACTTLVSECFVSVTLTGEYESGEEFVTKNAWGELCINDKDPDILKRVTATIEFAEINPDALDIIVGATPIVSSGDTIGSTFGPSVTTESFALEVWTKNTGADCSATDPVWGYFVLPFVKNGKIDGDITIENAALTMSVMGDGFPATDAWGTTPYTDNPLSIAFPAGDIFGIATTTVQPPTDTNGCVPYVVDVPEP